jgi:hypothetical protein
MVKVLSAKRKAMVETGGEIKKIKVENEGTQGKNASTQGRTPKKSVIAFNGPRPNLPDKAYINKTAKSVFAEIKVLDLLTGHL